MTGAVITVAPAVGAQDIAAAKDLCRAYAQSLGFDLAYQDFEAELAEFPGKYAPPGGALLLGRLDGVVAGVVALRDLSEGVSEMKRLYVAPAARGSGLGLALAEAIIIEARRLRYRAMRLDTVAGQHDRAIQLYERLGFHRIPAYYESPIPGTIYLELDL
jgi:GNAT superfamily N-acetyltransferase